MDARALGVQSNKLPYLESMVGCPWQKVVLLVVY
jgi:hypothetical protein